MLLAFACGSGPGNSDSLLRCIPYLLDGHEMAKRRNFIDQFKAKVAREALRCDKTIQEVQHGIRLTPTK